MADNNVLRVNSVEEERLFRQAVHEALALIIAEHDATLIDIAEAIDCSVKTISNAFNRTNNLSFAFLQRLGTKYGVHVLNPIARLNGARMVPLEADEALDALPSTTAAVHKLAIARSPKSDGGERITHRELLDLEPEIDAAMRALEALKCRCQRIRNAA